MERMFILDILSIFSFLELQFGHSVFVSLKKIVLWKRNVSIAAKKFAAALIRNSVLTSAGIIIITDLIAILIISSGMCMVFLERTEEFSPISALTEKQEFIRMLFSLWDTISIFLPM